MRLKKAAAAVATLASGTTVLIGLAATPAHATSYSLYGDNGQATARLDYTYYVSTGHPGTGIWYTAYAENTHVWDEGDDGHGSVIKITFDTTAGPRERWKGIIDDGGTSFEPDEFWETGVRNVRFYLCRWTSGPSEPCDRMTTTP